MHSVDSQRLKLLTQVYEAAAKRKKERSKAENDQRLEDLELQISTQ